MVLYSLLIRKIFVIICESDVAGGWMSRCGKETLVGFKYVMSVCLGGELTQMNIHIGFMNINVLFPTDLLIIVRAVIVKRLMAV